jgi:cobaltochelatase CobS
MAQRTPVKKKKPPVDIEPATMPKPEPTDSLNGNHRDISCLNDIRALYPDRPKAEFSIRDIFTVDLGPEKDDEGNVVTDKQGKPIMRDRNVMGFAEPGPHTPQIDPNYVFARDETLALLMAMSGEPKDPSFLVGHTGTGKTSLVEQIAARLNYNVIKISFDAAIARADLCGEYIIKGREMVFQYGILAIAFLMPGTIILLDEWDAQNEETAFVLQRPLQKEDRKLFLLETLDLIEMHPDNFICATANTNGQGDETGLYSHGTRIQSYAQLNRFTVTVKMDYLPPDQEKKIVVNRFPDLDSDEIDSLVMAVNKVRDGFTNGELSVPLSTRDLLNWADKYIKFGDALKAATFCFLNRMSTEDAEVCKGIIQRSFEE